MDVTLWGAMGAVAKSNSTKNDLHLVLVGTDSEWRSLHLAWSHGTSHRPVLHYPPVGGFSATAPIQVSGAPRGPFHQRWARPRWASVANPGQRRMTRFSAWACANV